LVPTVAMASHVRLTPTSPPQGGQSSQGEAEGPRNGPQAPGGAEPSEGPKAQTSARVPSDHLSPPHPSPGPIPKVWVPSRTESAAHPPTDPLPIAEHGIIGNFHSAALVGTNGTIDFLCWPHFGSPTVFAAALDPNLGGFFQIAARDPKELRGKQVRTTLYYTSLHYTTSPPSLHPWAHKVLLALCGVWLVVVVCRCIGRIRMCW